MSKEKAKEIIIEAMKQPETPPELIYAFEKTGLLITDENAELKPTHEIDAWNAAVAEYLEDHPEAFYPPEEAESIEQAESIEHAEGAESTEVGVQARESVEENAV